jgi:hypothetical protein
MSMDKVNKKSILYKKTPKKIIEFEIEITP